MIVWRQINFLSQQGLLKYITFASFIAMFFIETAQWEQNYQKLGNICQADSTPDLEVSLSLT